MNGWLNSCLSDAGNSKSAFLVFKRKVITYGDSFLFTQRIQNLFRERHWKKGDFAIIVGYPDERVPLFLLAGLSYGLNILVIDPQSFVVKGVAELENRFHGVIRLDEETNDIVIPEPKSKTNLQGSAIGEEEGSLVVLTSGSTGDYKLVTLSLNTVFDRALIESKIFGIRRGDVNFNVLGFAHELGLTQIFSTLIQGASLHIVPAAFSGEILLAIKEIRPVGIVATPFFWERLLQSVPENGLSEGGPRWVSISGGLLSSPNHKRLSEYFLPEQIIRTYGKSETGRTLYNPNPNFECPNDLGFPVPGVQVQLIEEVESGAKRLGEKVKEGNLVHFGMGLSKEASLDAENFQGGHQTGDYFHGTSIDGYFYLGRKDRMIKRFVQRIHLEQIERDLGKIESIERVVVLTDEGKNRWGTKGRILAFVEMRDSDSVKNLHGCISRIIRKPFIPDQIIQIIDWPQTRSHKIDTAKLISMVDKNG